MTPSSRDSDDVVNAGLPFGAPSSRSSILSSNGAAVPSTSPTRGTRDRRPLPRHASVRRDDPPYFYASLIAGAGSGALSSVLCAPLDLVRVRMQVWGQVRGGRGSGSGGGAATMVPIRQILREIRLHEGYRGFFKGLGATLLTVPVFWAIYFPCYDELKYYWHRRYAGDSSAATPMNPSVIHMISAVQAGAIADIVCNPMFLVRTRLQTQALHDMANRRPATSDPSSALRSSAEPPRTLSIAATVRNLYGEGGLRGFWRGMTANLLGLSHVAIQFPLYEQLKVQLRGPHKSHESPTDLLLASSLSKMMASLVSYPHEVIRSRMMDSREVRHPQPNQTSPHSRTMTAPATATSFSATCRSIYQSEGIRGFYSGMPITLIRVIPNTCVTFVTYELLLRWCTRHRERLGLRW